MSGFAPICSTPISAQPHSAIFFTAQTFFSIIAAAADVLYAATIPFITRSTDDPANQPFEGTLEPTLRIDRSIVTADGYGGFSENISELSLINTDGFYDDIADQISINGQSIRCSIGEVTGRAIVAAYASFEPIMTLTGERTHTERNHVVIEMRDPALHLATETVQQSIYAGTGELEGGEEIAGKRRPFGDGPIFNATPTLVVANELLWQFNDGPVASVFAVKDGGVELTFYADYPTVAALRADAVAASPDIIPPGTYATCIAEGYFVTGGTNFKQITIDFIGSRLTTADIIENVALTSAMLDSDDLDMSSFDDLNTAQSASVGYYLDSNSNETCAEMFTKLMNGIGGWWGMTPLGKLQVKRFERPISIAGAYYNTEGGNIVSIDRSPLPAGIDPPPHRWRVIYGRNFTVMTDLFGEVSENDPAQAEYLMDPYKLASTSEAQSEAILANWPDAPDRAPVESYFALAIDAQAEADRLFELYSTGFTAYRITLKNALFVHGIGEVVNITDSRLGLADGRYLRIVGLSDDTSSMTTEVIAFG